MLHIPDEDVSNAVPVSDLTAEQRRVIDLLELNPDGRPTVRLTWGQWRWVNRVVVTLGALGVPPVRAAVPAPRTSVECQRAAQAPDGGGIATSGPLSDSEGSAGTRTPAGIPGANQGVK